MKPEFYRKKLENGLTILFEKRNQQVVSIASGVRCGSSYEPENKKGISHFIEHLIFKGTKSRNHKQIVGEVEKKGGVLNAFTGEEITSFWNKMPSNHFSTGIEIARDLILNPKLDKQEFEKERKVILEEIKMYHDTPHFYVLDKIKSLLYKKPFGLSGLGTEKTLAKLTRNELVNFYMKNYSANRMFLCIVGNADMSEIESYGEKFPKTSSREIEIKPKKINSKAVEKRKGLEQANFAFGFHTYGLLDRKRYANEIFNIILAHGMSSRLFEEIREKRSLAYDVRSFIEQGKNYGYQIIYAGTKKENVDLCREIIVKEIKKMNKLAGKDFEEAKEQLIGLRKVESEESVNVMNALMMEEIGGNAEEYYKYEDRILKARLEEVRKLAKLKNYSSFSLIPD